MALATNLCMYIKDFASIETCMLIGDMPPKQRPKLACSAHCFVC